MLEDLAPVRPPNATSAERSATSPVPAPRLLPAALAALVDTDRSAEDPRRPGTHDRPCCSALTSYLSYLFVQLLVRRCRPLVPRLRPGREVLQLLWRRAYHSGCSYEGACADVFSVCRVTSAATAPSLRSVLAIPAGLRATSHATAPVSALSTRPSRRSPRRRDGVLLIAV